MVGGPGNIEGIGRPPKETQECSVTQTTQLATRQKAEINKLELGSQLKRTWQNLLRDHFEEAMRTSSSASPLMANPFVRTAGQLVFAWSLDGIELETLTSRNKLKLGGKSLEIYQTMMQHVARDNSGLSLARRRDATCFLR